MNKEQDCECGLNQEGKWSDAVFDRFGCSCDEDHDCWDNAQPYEFEEHGRRYHGWECGICGELLQTG